MGHLKRSSFPNQKGYKHRTTPQAVAKRDLAEQCLSLRREGLANSEIARRLNGTGGKLDEYKVADLILGRLKEREVPLVEDIRREELDRLDRIFNRAMTLGLGDKNRDRTPALGMALKAMERRAALLGLDAPKQTEMKVTTPHAPSTATAEDIVARLAEEARREGADAGSGDGDAADRAPGDPG